MNPHYPTSRFRTRGETPSLLEYLFTKIPPPNVLSPLPDLSRAKRTFPTGSVFSARCSVSEHQSVSSVQDHSPPVCSEESPHSGRSGGRRVSSGEGEPGWQSDGSSASQHTSSPPYFAPPRYHCCRLRSSHPVYGSPD